MARKPALSLAAVPGRRSATLELAQRIEKEGYAGIYCPSMNDGLALCEALAQATKTIPFGTSIANIYTRHASDFAKTASFVHEIVGRALPLRDRREPRAHASAAGREAGEAPGRHPEVRGRPP